MSARQILEELPKLSHDERKDIARLAMELNWDEAERDAVECAEACALESFKVMDELEAADDERKNPAR